MLPLHVDRILHIGPQLYSPSFWRKWPGMKFEGVFGNSLIFADQASRQIFKPLLYTALHNLRRIKPWRFPLRALHLYSIQNPLA